MNPIDRNTRGMRPGLSVQIDALQAEIAERATSLSDLSTSLRALREQIKNDVYKTLTDQYGFQSIQTSDFRGFIDGVKKEGIEISLLNFWTGDRGIRVDIMVPISPVDSGFRREIRQELVDAFIVTRCKGTHSMTLKGDVWLNEDNIGESVSEILRYYENGKELFHSVHAYNNPIERTSKLDAH